VTIVPARLAELRGISFTKRDRHPELAKPLTLAGLRRIVKREHVELSIRPHPRLGELVPLLGRWLIIVDERQPKKAWTICAAHELAHLWLHHDPYFARHETTVYDASPPWYDIVREEEADVFAELLVRGPDGTSRPNQSSALRMERRISEYAKLRNSEIPDPDGGEFLERVKRAPKEPLPAPDPSPLVQFAIRRDVWSSVDLLAVRRRAGHWHYRDNLGDSSAPSDFQFVTCSERVGLAIVEQLARVGHKRSAARIRRTIRQTRTITERE
jgi:hypothetical protein